MDESTDFDEEWDYVGKAADTAADSMLRLADATGAFAATFVYTALCQVNPALGSDLALALRMSPEARTTARAMCEN